METAKRKGKSYIVTKVSQNMIFDFKELVRKQQWTADIDKGEISLKNKEICVDTEYVKVVKFKTNFENDSKCIYIEKKNVHIDFKTYKLPEAYSSDLGIAKPKLNDLLFLCTKNAIPPLYHPYYNSLKCSLELQSKQKATRRESESSESEGYKYDSNILP